MRLRTPPARTGRTIVVVDDNPEFLVTIERLLAREGHSVHPFASPVAALEWLRRSPADLVMVDYFMPEMTGEQLVHELRTFNPMVQVLLQTGYASEQPAREVLRRLDIQGYVDKSEGPEKLLLWVDVALRAAASVAALERARLGLRYILDVTPEMHRPQPLADLLQGILLQTTGLFGVVDSFLAVVGDPAAAPAVPDGFVALVDESSRPQVRAATGRFAAVGGAPVETTRVGEALASRKIEQVDGAMVVPLLVGGNGVGAIYLDRPVVDPRDLELLGILANQAAVAIHNSFLYEMAAFDPLSGTYTRRFFMHALDRELRVAHRARQPLAMVLVDLDRMKMINDRGGHLAGDAALKAVGRILRRCTRATDVVGRYGGDEFAIVLPGAGAPEAELVARRILAAFRSLEVAIAGGSPQAVRASLGMAVLTPPGPREGPPRLAAETLDETQRALFACADEALYTAKHAGGDTAHLGVTAEWAGDPPQ